VSETEHNDRPPRLVLHQWDGSPAKERSAFLGQILVEEGVLSRDELRSLVRCQRDLPSGERVPLGRLAVQEGYLDEGRFLSLLDQHGSRLHIGELLLSRRLLQPSDLDRAMRGRERGEMLGAALLRLGLIDPWALAEGLAEQTGIACFPIHRIPVTPDLAKLVGASFCVARGVVPVVCRDRCLVLALWRPQDLPAAETVEQMARLQVMPVLTTRREIQERIRLIYLDSEEERQRAA
jgi:hypothetical protein